VLSIAAPTSDGMDALDVLRIGYVRVELATEELEPPSQTELVSGYVRSHLGKRPEHEIPDFCPRRSRPAGGAPRSGPDPAGKGWGTRGFGFESAPGGVPIGSTGGGGGAPSLWLAAAGRAKAASKAETAPPPH
jgi:hypothetical protein